jgi:TPR repeat protein
LVGILGRATNANQQIRSCAAQQSQSGFETRGIRSSHLRGLRDARKLLKPLVEKNIAEAQYLAASFALAHEFKSDAAEKKWRYDLLYKAAESGYPPAQFALGQAWHYGDLGHDPEKSAYWFSLSAEQGYVHGQWAHGCNLLGGSGLPKDEALGITFIRKAAENKFEGALQFIADAYEEGKFGFQKDPQLATFWREKLKDDDVNGYYHHLFP